MPETSSQYYPIDVFPLEGSYHWIPRGMLHVETSISGTEQRLLDYEHREFFFVAGAMTQDQLNNMDFFLKNYAKSGYLAFNFFDFKEEHFVTPEFVGNTPDTSGNLQIPFRETTNPTAVYDDGLLLTSWGHTAGYGPGGEGRITSMNPVPGVGSAITAVFYGRKRYVVRLEGAATAGELFMGGAAFDPTSGKYLSNYEFHLKELL